MDIRKLIKEQLESLFENNGGKIIGADIVSYLNDLPQTRDEVNWNSPRTKYDIPALDNRDAHTEAYDKEFFTGWDRPYLNKGKMIPHSGPGYVYEFESKFKEKPIFRIHGRQIEILNPKFIAWKSRNPEISGANEMGSLD